MFREKTYKYKGTDVVIVKDGGKLVTIKNKETKITMKVQRHLIEGLK